MIKKNKKEVAPVYHKAAAPKKEEEAPVEKKVEVVMPVVDHLQVVKILDDEMSTKDQYHCMMENGTTMHVDKTLFE